MPTLLRLLYLLVFASSIFAQVDLGQLSGEVQDPSGARIKTVTIDITNVQTALKRRLETDTEGAFLLPSLTPGVYHVIISSPSFQSLATDVVISGGQVVSRIFTLAVGTAEQSVTVTAGSSIDIEASSHEIRQNYTPAELTQLPTDGRNPLSVAITGTAAGAASDPTVSTSSGQFFQTTANQIVINGRRDVDTGYMQDGVQNVTLLTQSANLIPSVESIQQLTVIVNGADARYAQPGIVNIITKSGANQFHGSAWNFFKNDYLNARAYNLSGTPQTSLPLRSNQFGGALGGRIVKDRLFFFSSYGGLRSATTSYVLARVPTSQELQGDFSGQTKLVFDPLSYNPTTGTTTSFLATTGRNAVPLARLNAFATKFNPYYPISNIPLNAALNVNYQKAIRNATVSDQGLGRLDWNPSAKDQLQGAYGHGENENTQPNFAPNIYDRLYTGQADNAYAQEVHAFSPRLVNTLRFGYNRSHQFQTETGAGLEAYTEHFGLRNLFPQPEQWAPPTVGISGFNTMGTPFAPQGAIQNRFQFADQLNFSAGSHSLFFGAEFVRTLFYGNWTINNNGNYTFDGTFTSSYTGGARSTTANGVPYADFLLGYPARAAGATGVSVGAFRRPEFAAYAQDDWKVTSRLTLNLGVRYQFASPPNDANGRASVYDLPSNQTLRGSWKANYRDLAPRLGLAWRLGENTVLRGGYGIYYSDTPWNYLQFLLAHAPNFIPQAPAFNILNPTTTENVFVANPSSAGQTPQTLGRSMPDTYVEQYNFFIAHTFAHNYLAEIGYSGERGHNESVRVNANQPNAIAPGTTTTRYNLRPYSYIGDVFAQYNLGYSNSNGLQAKLQRQFSNGLRFTARYIFSKALDISDGDRIVISNYYNPRIYYGPSAYDRKHQFTITGTYELPLGRGRQWLRTMPHAVDTLVGGWQLSGVYTVTTGLPVTITATNNADTTSIGTFLAQKVCDPTDGFTQTRTKYFNTACFLQPGAFQYGSGGRGGARGPGLNNLDLSLVKAFTVKEGHSLQLRMETFNTVNHPQFSLPGTVTLTNAAFGALTGTSRPMRNLQMALRYSF